jgi:endoglucanase
MKSIINLNNNYMEQLLLFSRECVRKMKLTLLLLTVGLILPVTAWSQLPTAQQIASQMKVGWNLGNSLEAMCDETA